MAPSLSAAGRLERGRLKMYLIPLKRIGLGRPHSAGSG